MKINIFGIPTDDLAPMTGKLEASGMEVIKEVEQDGWRGRFFYSTRPTGGKIPWAETFQSYFDEGHPLPTSRNPYAVFVFTKGKQTYALSFGKTHFYIRPYCDYDFGIELAKRIANETDTRQTASRRFQGRKKKDIKSYTTNSRLDVESGESVDYIQAGIIESKREPFGKSGKFGTSALLNPAIIPAEIGPFLSQLEAEVHLPARFPLPRTTIITELSEVSRLDESLLNELTSTRGTSEFTHNSYDLYGVDFVFSNDGTFEVSCPGEPHQEYEDLSMGDLKDYIQANAVAREDILQIRIRHKPEGSASYVKTLKEAIDFIPPDGANVLLTGGKWMHFNQDYLDFLNGYLAEISVEETEPEFAEIGVIEAVFNASDEVRDAGYALTDKDFEILRTRASTPIEAWDLSRGDRVYAVKFGTPQKLHYVCDQATAVLELLRNRAEVGQVPNFKSYCLWLGYRAQNQLESIDKTGSIILKQKIESWARKARDLGIEPVIKISRRVKPGIDDAASRGN